MNQPVQSTQRFFFFRNAAANLAGSPMTELTRHITPTGQRQTELIVKLLIARFGPIWPSLVLRPATVRSTETAEGIVKSLDTITEIVPEPFLHPIDDKLDALLQDVGHASIVDYRTNASHPDYYRALITHGEEAMERLDQIIRRQKVGIDDIVNYFLVGPSYMMTSLARAMLVHSEGAAHARNLIAAVENFNLGYCDCIVLSAYGYGQKRHTWSGGLTPCPGVTG